jgi:hypothetical protein
MKVFGIPMVVMSLLGFGLLSGLDAPPARADFTFGEPVNLTPVIPVLDPMTDMIASFSADGLEMYLSSLRPGAYGYGDIWVSRRDSTAADWNAPEHLGLPVNSPDAQWTDPGNLSADGLELYFDSPRPEGYGGGDLYVATRETRTGPWREVRNLGPKVNSPSHETWPCISPDGLELYFLSDRAGGVGGFDIHISRRATTKDPWGDPENLGPVVNSETDDGSVGLSPDGLLLFFADAGGPRPGGYGGFDLWMTRRAGLAAPWGSPLNVGPRLNGPNFEVAPRVSPDGSWLYWSWGNADWTAFDNWRAPILPIVDFNADGKVDAADLTILVTNWGKSNSVCDIGPFAWGDGIVDTYDLSVLLKEMTGSGIALNPRSDASEVAGDAILSWTSVSFAQSYDVYLGTSQEAVKTASRTDPQGVLVNQGQAATTYDPPGLLEFSKTYYWRVDFVISSPVSAIYQGPVLKFTTEAYAYPITSITATASSSKPAMGPESTINGSGLDKNGGHSTEPMDMWLSTGTPPNWIQYQFDKVYALHELWVWNSNQMVEPFIGFGAKTVNIEYSTDGTKWTQLANVPEFARASGQSGYVHNTTVSFGGVSAKFVKLTIEKGWGATPSTGLSEVRFFYIPSASTPKP